jgi:meso-butanediol dehydrogenase / (S,S)-butanediol dehydrogenase / diacetyl reductase
MSDRIAVITGAGSGIGRAIARELSRRGLGVVVTDLDGDAADAVARELDSSWSEPFDVTDGAAANRLAERVVARHGSLDVWVSCAGISKMGPFIDVAEADLDRTLDVNLKGVFLCGQAAARVMRSSGRAGVIVNVASMAGKQGRVPYLADYVASKFGVVGLTQAMAFELAADGIRVNAVCPGYVATPMQERELEWESALRGVTRAEVLDMWVADTPMGRVEQPEDVARVVGFLVSEDAGFVTGESVAVNGGAFMD